MATIIFCFGSHNFNSVAIFLLTSKGIEASLHALSVALSMEKQKIKLIMNFETFSVLRSMLSIYIFPPFCSVATR
jgi:uncharacterized membrane protein